MAHKNVIIIIIIIRYNAVDPVEKLNEAINPKAQRAEQHCLENSRGNFKIEEKN